MHLYRPGVLSALGSGMEATVERLLDPAPSSLTLSDQWVAGRTLPLGQVTVPLRPFDATLADELAFNEYIDTTPEEVARLAGTSSSVR